MTAKSKTEGGPLEAVSTLIEIGKADTVYRDVYLERARALLEGVLSPEDFHRHEQQRAQLSELPVAIARAVERADWPAVKELSGRAQTLRRAAEGKRGLIETAREVYAVADVRLDPFSPGLLPFVRLATKDLATLRTRVVGQLTALEGLDAPWRDFYRGRRAAFQALVVATAKPGSAAAPIAAGADPRKAAADALKQGDMKRLEKLADTLMAGRPAAKEKPSTPGPAAAATPEQGQPPARELVGFFSADTVTRARRLGLALRRLQPRTEVAGLRQYAWNPLFSDESGRLSAKAVSLPGGTPEAFRERLEILMIHPLVNSGGARHLPTLVAEDVLVEDFPDFKTGEEPLGSELLTALGLPGRRAVPRIAIEQALLARGGRVVEGALGLDPHAFRLVCIPPDVHLRIGEEEGWGRQPMWTHFDGYLVMADGRLRALAGGDARFGGLYDLLGIGRDYDSDRVIARFAVVCRERMVAW
jgi:hypothetical protein